MTALLTVPQLRAQVSAEGMTDAELARVAAREQAYIERFAGAATGSRSKRLALDNYPTANIYLPRRISTVTSLYEAYSNPTSGSARTLLTEETDFIVWADEGRIQRIAGGSIPFLPYGYPGPTFLPQVYVTWTPVDDTEEREACLIALTQSAVADAGYVAEEAEEARAETGNAQQVDARRAAVMRRYYPFLRSL